MHSHAFFGGDSGVDSLACGVESLTLWHRLTLLYGDHIKPRRNLAD